MPRLQMTQQPSTAHVLLEKDVLVEKLPPLRRGFSCHSSSGLRIPQDKEQQKSDNKDLQKNFFSEKMPDFNWKKNTATAGQNIFSDKQGNQVFGSKQDVHSVFPLKPVCHRRAFSVGNRHPDSDGSVQKDKRSLDDRFPRQYSCKHIRMRSDERNKSLEPFKSKFHQKSSNKSLEKYQIFHEEQQRLYDNEKRLRKEIHKKEILLLEKLKKAEEGLRKVQLKTASDEMVKKEKNKNTAMGRPDILYKGERGTWETAIRCKRDEAQSERIRDWVRTNGRDDVEECKVRTREMNLVSSDKHRGDEKSENKERILHRNTNCRTQRNELGAYEDISKQNWEMVRNGNKKRGERAAECRNERREQDQRDWQKDTINREKKWDERMKPNINMEVNEEQWIDKLKTGFHIERKASSKHLQMPGFTKAQRPTAGKTHQYNRSAENTADYDHPKKHRNEAGSHRKQLQQGEQNPEQKDILKQSRVIVKNENEKLRKEKAAECRNEMREQEQRDWQKPTINGEKKWDERMKPRNNMEVNEEQQIDKTGFHVERKSSSKHLQMAFINPVQPSTVGKPHHYNNRPVTAEYDHIKEHGTESDSHLNQLQQVDPSPEPEVELIPCNICRRNFLPERLEKHSRICEKMQSKRKTFDSSQFRAKGTDLEAFVKMNGRRKSPEPKKNTWRQQHEALVRNMQRGRAPGGVQTADVNLDYVPCPHCGRSFAPGPAERHIPKCQNIKSRPPPPRK